MDFASIVVLSEQRSSDDNCPFGSVRESTSECVDKDMLTLPGGNTPDHSDSEGPRSPRRSAIRRRQPHRIEDDWRRDDPRGPRKPKRLKSATGVGNDAIAESRPQPTYQLGGGPR